MNTSKNLLKNNLLKVDLNLTDLLEETIEWNRVANEGEFIFTDLRQTLQHACLAEEIKELEDAIIANDPVEVVDAICDILFVGVYAWYMRTARIYDVSLLCKNIGCVSTEYTLTNLLVDLKIALDNYHYLEICQLILSSSVMFDFSLKEAYREVVASNFTKFPLVDEIDVEDELNWFREYSKYQDVIGTVINNERVVFRSNYGGGKVVKPRCFNEPKLFWFIPVVAIHDLIGNTDYFDGCA